MRVSLNSVDADLNFDSIAMNPLAPRPQSGANPAYTAPQLQLASNFTQGTGSTIGGVAKRMTTIPNIRAPRPQPPTNPTPGNFVSPLQFAANYPRGDYAILARQETTTSNKDSERRRLFDSGPEIAGEDGDSDEDHPFGRPGAQPTRPSKFPVSYSIPVI